MNPIRNAACLIAAYETTAGLPDSERITQIDGTWRLGVTEQQAASLCRQAQAPLAPEAKLFSTGCEALIDQTRDSLLVRKLVVGDTVLFAATESYAGLGDFTLRAGIIRLIDPKRETCSVRGHLSPMDDIPLRYVLGRYDLDLYETHYGVPCVRPLLGEHLELTERYLREAKTKWNASYGQSTVTTEVLPDPTLGGLGRR